MKLEIVTVKNCYKLDINEAVKRVDRKDAIDHGLRFVMDYNEDRWGFTSWNDDIDDRGQVMTKDVLENKNAEIVTKTKTDARIYFQNIGK